MVAHPLSQEVAVYALEGVVDLLEAEVEEQIFQVAEVCDQVVVGHQRAQVEEEGPQMDQEEVAALHYQEQEVEADHLTA